MKKTENKSTQHYRSWTITINYNSKIISWWKSDLKWLYDSNNEDYNSELIGNSINDSKFVNWKVFKIMKQIDKISKDQEEKTAKEMLERLGL